MPRSKHGSLSSIAADPAKLEEHDLSIDYKVKDCVLCGGCSLDINPLFLKDPSSSSGQLVDIIVYQQHPDFRTWKLLDPWAAGTRAVPTGQAHRVCLNAFHDGAYADHYGSAAKFLEAAQKDPTLNSDFLSSRNKLLELKRENPTLRLRNKDMLKPARFIEASKGSATRMKRKRKFVKLEKFEQKYGKGKVKKHQIVSKPWKGKIMRGIIIEETSDEWDIESEECAEVTQRTVSQVDALGLLSKAAQSSSASSIYDSAVKQMHDQLGSSAADAAVIKMKPALTLPAKNFTAESDAEVESNEEPTEMHRDEDQCSQPLLSQESTSSMGDICLGTMLFDQNEQEKVEPTKSRARGGGKQKDAKKGIPIRTKAQQARSKPKPAKETSTTSPMPSTFRSSPPTARTASGNTDDASNKKRGGRGRKSEVSVCQEDDDLIDEFNGKLQHLLASVAEMPSETNKLKEFANQQLSELGTIAASLQDKSRAVKRRKTSASGSEYNQQFHSKIAQILNTVHPLRTVYQELKAPAPNAKTLDANIKLVEGNCSYMLPASVHIIRCKALIMDKLRFNKFNEIADMMTEAGLQNSPGMANLVVADSDFMKGLILTVQQMIVKLVMKLPVAGLQFDDQYLKIMNSIVVAIMAKDHLCVLPVHIMKQFLDLSNMLNCLASEVHPRECLRVLDCIEGGKADAETIDHESQSGKSETSHVPSSHSCEQLAESCEGSSEDLIILRIFASCPQGLSFLHLVRAVCRKRLASKSLLVKMHDIKEVFHALQKEGFTQPDSMTKFQEQVAKYVSAKSSLQKVPENAALLKTLDRACEQVLGSAVTWHCNHVLVPHLESATQSIKDNRNLEPLPDFTIDTILSNLQNKEHPISKLTRCSSIIQFLHAAV